MEVVNLDGLGWFPRRYDVTVIQAGDDRSGIDGADWYGPQDGTGFFLSPRVGHPWVAGWCDWPVAAYRLLSTPHPAILCVLESTGGYLLRADQPGRDASLEDVGALPPYVVAPSFERSLLVFAGISNGVACLGARGWVWRTELKHLRDPQWSIHAVDSLEVVGDIVRGEASAEAQVEPSRFELDLLTGRQLA